jgi:hypothetical protein
MNPESAHRPLGKLKLNDILCWQYERVMNHDFTFTFQNPNNGFYSLKKINIING